MTPAPAPQPATALAIALAGMASLAVAMGIGRFAFTPLMPMMLADGAIDLHAASWLASANYIGYLVGALFSAALPALWARLTPRPLIPKHWLRGSLVAVCVLTLAMMLPSAAAWPALRFAAGVATAIAFVFTSGWCLAGLASRGASALGGIVYAGPGFGIVASGLAASGMVALHWQATPAWGVFGVMALGVVALAWRTFGQADAAPTAASPAARTAVGGWLTASIFVFTYGLSGFGYIVTATFLPVIARVALPGSAWLDLFWPLLGTSVAAGALLSTRVPARHDFRAAMAAGYLLQAFGVIIAVWWPTLVGFVIGSITVGLPFTAITFFGMQEARRLRPATAASFMAVVTVAYSVGQILGPPMVALVLARSPSTAHGFDLALEIAAAALLLGAALCLALMRASPRSR